MNTSSKRHYVLIIHPGTLGDVLLSLPAIRMVRRTFSSHEIILIAQSQVGRLLQVCGEIDHAWSTEGAVLSALYGERPALRVPILEALSQTTHVVGWLADGEGRLTRNCRKFGIQQRQFISPKDARLRSRHMSERYVETLTSWAEPFENGRIAFCPLTMHGLGDVAPHVEGVGDARDTKTVLMIHPGSGSPHKCLSFETLGRLVHEVARDPAVRVLICEGPNDRDCVERLLCKVGETSYGILREKTLEEMSHLLIHADLFLGHDSGLTHLAAAWGVPTVAIFGPTDPEQWRPLGEHVVVQNGPLCRCRTWAQVQECRERVCVTHSVEALLGVVRTLIRSSRPYAVTTNADEGWRQTTLLARPREAMFDT